MMRRALLSLLVAAFLLSLPLSARADTPVSGLITWSPTWTLEGSPYIVVGTVTVAHSSTPTLTIEPGVVVRFNAGTSLVIGSSSTNRGTLQAQGTVGQPILFTANTGSPTPGFWQSLQIKACGATASRIAHATIEYGGSAAAETGGLHVHRTAGAPCSPVIQNATIRSNAFAGASVQGGSPELETVLITGNTGFAMVLAPDVTLGPTSGLSFIGNGTDAVQLYPLVSWEVDVSTTWKNIGYPYVVGYHGISVQRLTPPTATLTIEPGVILRFSSGTYLSVGSNGLLHAIGTSGQPITFTAHSASPTPGFWAGIGLQGTAAGPSRISYASITYGQQLAIYSASPTIDNTTIQYESYAGLVVGGSSSRPILDTVAITNNPSFAIRVDADVTLGPISDLTVSGNGTDGIQIRTGTIYVPTTWKDIGLPYIVSTNVAVGAPAAPVLTLEPGLLVKFNSGVSLGVGTDGSGFPGGLVAVGTPSQPIRFTANTATPSPGFWPGMNLYLYGATTAEVRYAEVFYAVTGVTVGTGSPVFDHVTFSNSSSTGLSMGAGTATVVNCNFAGNANGLRNFSPTLMDARFNWWNAVSGPSGGGPGTGQSIFGPVRFEPWLAASASSPQFVTTFDHTNSTFNPAQEIYSSMAFATSLAGNWTLRIRNNAMVDVRQFTGSGSSGAATWDGRDGGGLDLPNGPYTYLLESTAGADAATPATGRLVLDRARPLALTDIALDNPFFSPNADSVKDTARLSANVNYWSTWTVEVKDTGGLTVRTLTGSGTSISAVWDGRNGGGTLQPDGVYTFNLSATAGTAVVTAVRTTTLDVTPPVASITQPADGAVLSNVYQAGVTDVSITGTANDANLWWWQLTENGVELRYSSSPVISAQLSNWPTLSRQNGSWALRLSVFDHAGNQSVITNTVTVGNFKVTASSFQVNSGASGTVTYTSVVPFDLTETLIIKNRAGDTVRTLVDGPRSAGSYNDIWNARDDAANLVPDGPYFYIASVTDGTYSLTWDLSTVMRSDFGSVTIPAPPGAFDSFNNQPVTITYTLTDSFRTSVHVQSPTNYPYSDCATVPPQVACLTVDEYQPSGTHTFIWSGTRMDGSLFRFQGTGWVHVAIRHNNFPQNAVVVFGTAPRLTNPRVTPPMYRPINGDQTVSVVVASYQSQPVDISVQFLNQDSLTVLRTVTLAAQPAGTVSVTWDGRADNGMWVAPGLYTAVIAVTDSIGNTASIRAITKVFY